MSYNNPNRQVYILPSLDWGNNVTEGFGIVGPKGKSGRLIDYGMQGVTETFTATITVQVGTAADPNAYGDVFDVNGAAADEGMTVLSTYNEQDAGFAALMVNQNLPADTPVLVTVTGAVAAGIGSPYVVIDWAD